jgi:Flp pilus assembly protein TadD
MSLLLDALKKAADKKKESEDLSLRDDLSDNNEAENLEDELTDENLDLDLQLENVEDDFPLVDEEIDEIEDDIKEEIDSVVEERIDDEQVDDALLIDEEKILDKNERGIEEATDEIEADVDEIYLPEKEEAIEESNLKDTETEKKQNNKARSFKNKDNEAALSALINKSNRYTKSNKTKSIVIYSAIMLMILSGSIFYYYIEFSSSTQDIFVADSLFSGSSDVEIAESQAATVKKIVPVITDSKRMSSSYVDEQPVKQVSKKVIKSSKTKKRKVIKVVRKTVEDPVDSLIRQAYESFLAKDYEKSEKLYKRALSRENKNRDALLGLAAIAIKQQRYEYARQKYLNLLKLDPKDSFALAGLSTIGSQVDPQLNESQLKFMIRDQPDAAHLYFALGSHYAEQKKWAEAQSSFFSAWSAENTNADYCYNLAVSLDHLGKKDNAKDFYKLSIKLKKISGGNFSEEDAEDRITNLQENDS